MEEVVPPVEEGVGRRAVGGGEPVEQFGVGVGARLGVDPRIEECSELIGGPDLARQLPQGMAGGGRVDVAEAGHQPHRDRRVADGLGHRAEDAGRHARRAGGHVVLVEAPHQRRKGGSGVGQEGGVIEGGEVGAGVASGVDRGPVVEQLGPVGAGHDPAGVGFDLGGQMGLGVVGVLGVGRHVGVVAEEGEIELLDGDERVAHPLHADVRQVQVEVPAEESEDLGQHRIVLVRLVQPGPARALGRPVDDALVPGELLAQRADRRGHDLTGIGPGVVGPALTRLVVGEPPVIHPWKTNRPLCSRQVQPDSVVRTRAFGRCARLRSRAGARGSGDHARG